MRILVLCRQSDLPWYGWAYWPALERQGARLSFIPEETSEGADIELLLACCPERPSLILRPDYHQFALPWGLTKADIPTVVFQPLVLGNRLRIQSLDPVSLVGVTGF